MHRSLILAAAAALTLGAALPAAATQVAFPFPHLTWPTAPEQPTQAPVNPTDIVSPAS